MYGDIDIWSSEKIVINLPVMLNYLYLDCDYIPQFTNFQNIRKLVLNCGLDIDLLSKIPNLEYLNVSFRYTTNLNIFNNDTITFDKLKYLIINYVSLNNLQICINANLELLSLNVCSPDINISTNVNNLYVYSKSGVLNIDFNKIKKYQKDLHKSL